MKRGQDVKKAEFQGNKKLYLISKLLETFSVGS